ncbi:MAG TPA: S8 family serine peptidase [Streptosporangiaceae bacterium]|nr:S8 family serine peptidase [Streptosporangiaceae bacterium]
MAQRLRGRATAAVAAGLAVACIAVAAGPAFAETVRNEEWWLNSLHVTKAWLSSRGAGVTVAVLDTGVDPTQRDLTGSVISGTDFTGSGRTPGGAFWGAHGTAVASLIAGHGHGGHHADGIMGVAPQAKILSVRVTLESKDPLLANPTVVAALPAAIARGIRYAVRHGAQVIDLPLDPAALAGGTGTGGSTQERSAVAAALRKGVVLVAPAGDGGAGADTTNYPAAYPGVISVGAFDKNFTKAAYSSQLPYVTLTAAGDGVIAANGLSGYAQLNSTGAASAVVAGIAALIRSQFPTLTPAQVSDALTSSTAFRPKNGQRNGSGFGTADAAAALVAAARINATLPSNQASAGNANPTPPATPVVKVRSVSLWDTLRYPVLGVAAILLLGLTVLTIVRIRQRRALDAQLAPLRAAAQASRAQSANGAASPGGTAAAGTSPVGTGAHGGGAVGTGHVGFDRLGPGVAGQGAAGPKVVSGAPPWAVQSGDRPPGAAEPPTTWPGAAEPPAGWAAASEPAVAWPGPAEPPAGWPGAGSPAASSPAPAQPGAGRPAEGNPGRITGTGGSTGNGARMNGGGSTGGEAKPGSGGAAANGSPPSRTAFGPAPFDDPAFEIPSFSGTGFGGSPFDDRAFGSAAADDPPFGSAAAGPPFGSAASDSPFGSAAADAPAGAASGGTPSSGTPPDGAPSGGAPQGGAAFGLPPAGEPPIPPVRTLGSMHRLNSVRTPKTSGHPPWEPAEKPAGDLPWMETPPPGGAHSRLTPRRAFPGSATGGTGPGPQDADQATADTGGGPAGGGPAGGGRDSRRRARKDRGPFPELTEPPSAGTGDASRDTQGADAGTPEGRPIYVWNPADTTEAFPAVPPEGTRHD